jgi:hypothetical protein
VELGLAMAVLTGTGGRLGLGRLGVRPWPRRGRGVSPARRGARGPYRRPAPLPPVAQTAPAGTTLQVRRAVGATPMPSGRVASGRCTLGKGRLGAQASVRRGRRGARRRSATRRGVDQPVTVPMDPALNAQNSQMLNRSAQSDE